MNEAVIRLAAAGADSSSWRASQMRLNVWSGWSEGDFAIISQKNEAAYVLSKSSIMAMGIK